MVNDFPFTESGNLRTFHENVNDCDLVWHWDEEDRIVKSITETDWMIQLDNQLPISLNAEVNIPAGMFHRLIKGTNELVVIINRK